MKKSVAISCIAVLAVLALVFGGLYISGNRARTAQVTALTEEVAEKAGKISQLESDVSGKTGEIETLNAEIAAASDQIKALEADITEKAGQIEGLNADAAEKDGRIEEIEADAAAKATQIEALEKDAAEAGAQIESLKSEVTEKAARIEELGTELTARETQIGNLETEAKEKDAEIETLKTDAAEHAARIEALEADLADRQTQMDTLKADGEKAANEITALNASVEEYKAKNSALEEEVRSVTAQLELLTAEAAEKDARIEALTTEIEAMKQSIPESASIPEASRPVVGSQLVFGHYEQDNDESNGPEPVEWLVLDVQDNKALLISRCGLDVQSYHPEQTDITWEASALRSWLNDSFMKAAFSTEEQAAILTTEVDNSESQGYSGWHTDGGNLTEDRMFLLSYAETMKYFPEESDRKCPGTAYVKARGASVFGGNCFWWLRSPGLRQYSAADMSSDGKRDYVTVTTIRLCVRPAFWMSLENGTF